VSTADLERSFGVGSVARLAGKTGIEERRVAADDELTSDLAVAAVEKLCDEHGVDARSIDYLLICTQTPDHPMPTTACIVHGRLGLRLDTGAIDIGMGCSGYIYGLGLATGLIESGQASNVVLVTADTVTKYINPRNKQLRTIFGDGAAATLISGRPGQAGLGAFTYGSDGSGAHHLLVPHGGLADPGRLAPGTDFDSDIGSNGYDMHMDGADVFTFTLRVVPEVVEDALRKSSLERDDIDLFVFHQANAFMLAALRDKIGIDEERFVVDMTETGNTMSSTIPIALARAIETGRAKPGMRVMLVGFGVGLSWGAVIATL
jgi:3-oxoacyl-[acyl-carrier-protein] synthase-3